MTSSKLLTSLTVLAALLPGLAAADQPGRGHAQFDFARVVDVEPIIRHVTIKTPYQECWQEQQVAQAPAQKGAAGSMLAGALIGGVIGNQFGGGDGKIYATMAGALIGTSVGHDQAIRRNAASSYAAPEVYNVERCDTRYSYEEQERIDGYNVSYEYRGQTYVTRMDEAPGKKIKVRVVVTPVAGY